MLTAQKLKMPLLVLHATGPRSADKMELLAKFLGKQVSDCTWDDCSYPHVKTASVHHKLEVQPTEDEPDPNEDLWGDWNGGVPTGDIARSPPQGLKKAIPAPPERPSQQKEVAEQKDGSCPKCAKGGLGNMNCCNWGGTWEGTCADEDDWQRGADACKSSTR